MKNIKNDLAKAILAIALLQAGGNLFAQSATMISSNPSANTSLSDDDAFLNEKKEEKVKFILNRRSSIKLLMLKEDSLKASMILVEKDIKKNLSEREQLATAAATLDKAVKSTDWASVNNQYKEKLKAYSALAKMRQQQRNSMLDLQKEKELYLKEIQEEEGLLAKLKDNLKERNKLELAGN